MPQVSTTTIKADPALIADEEKQITELEAAREKMKTDLVKKEGRIGVVKEKDQG